MIMNAKTLKKNILTEENKISYACAKLKKCWL